MKVLFLFLLLLIPLSGFQSRTDSLIASLPSAPEKDRVMILNNLASDYSRKSPMTCIYYGKLALELSIKLKNHRQEALALENIGLGNLNLGNYDEAINYFNYSDAKFKILNNIDDKGRLQLNLGNTCKAMGNYAQALTYYQNVLNLIPKMTDSNIIARAYINIGDLYESLTNNRKALDYYYKAEEILLQSPKDIRIAMLFNNIGRIFNLLDSNDKALDYYKQSLEVNTQIDNKYSVSVTYVNIGVLYNKKREFRKAFDYFSKAYNIDLLLNNKQGIATSLLYMGEVLNFEGKYAEAIVKLDESLKLAQSLNNKELIMHDYYHLSESYAGMGEYQRAWETHQKYSKIYESIFTYKIADVQSKFEMEDIKKLNLDKHDQALLLNTQRTYIYLLTAAILLFVILLSFMLYGYFDKKRAYRLLEERNVQLDYQYRFLQVLIDSIPNPVFYKDVDLKYLGCNKAFEMFTGRTKAELIGHTVFDYAGKDIADFTYLKDQTVLANPEIQSYETRVYNADNKAIEVLYFKSRFYDSWGNVAGLIGIMIDISERKKHEQILIESEMKLRELVITKDKYLEIINHELSQAAKYIMSLLPREINNGILSTRWSFIPSSQLGGDSFGYHWMDEDNFAIYLLDVSGHGVGAALHSVSILNTLKLQTLNNTDFMDPANVLKSLNELFQMRKNDNLFFTIWYGVYNKKKRTIKYASGGHHPALLVENDGISRRIATPNCLIGAVLDFNFTSDEMSVPEDSRLYIFSDGVFEIRKPDGKMWGYDAFCEYLISQKIYSNGSIDQLYNYAIEISFNMKLNDDYSILEIGFK